MAGDLTRDQLVTEVCDVVGKSVSASSVSGSDLQTRVRVYLNWAQQRIARFYNWRELQVIIESFTFASTVKRYPWVSGTNNMGLTRPRDIGSILLLDDYNSRRLVRVARPNFEKKYPRPENFANYRPRMYMVIGEAIEVFPIPDATYSTRIVYHQWPTPFTASSQTSDFSNKDQLLVVMTVMETYLALEEYSDAAIWFNKAMGMLTDAMKAEGDVDWEPLAEPIDLRTPQSISGAPWIEPGSTMDDPMYGYPMD